MRLYTVICRVTALLCFHIRAYESAVSFSWSIPAGEIQLKSFCWNIHSLTFSAARCLHLSLSVFISQAFIRAAVSWARHTALCQCRFDVLTLYSFSWHCTLNIYKCRASSGTFTNREARWCHGYYFSKKCSGFIHAQNMHHISAGKKIKPETCLVTSSFDGLKWT